jgi:amino acid transporter
MKRTILFSVGLLLAAATLVLAGSGMMAAFNWKSTTQDLGRIQQGKPVTIAYSFTNKGQEPLVITAARGSCGCTNVTHTQGAILPGQTGEVKGVYNAAAMGAFNKTISVESNAEGGIVTLSFKGEVVAAGEGQ